MNFLHSRNRRLIKNLPGTIEHDQISSLSIGARSGRHFTVFQERHCVDRPASRVRNGEQTNASLIRRSMLRRRWGGDRLFSGSATGRASAVAKNGQIRKRSDREAPNLDPLSVWRKTRQTACIFLKWTDLVVFDDDQQLSNWNYMLCFKVMRT